MRRVTLVASLSILLLFLLWQRIERRAAAGSNPTQVVMTTNAQWTGSWKGFQGLNHDQVSMNLTETCTYDVTDWSDNNISLDLDHCDTSFSAAGGGATTYHASYVKDIQWTYFAAKPSAHLTSLSLDPAAKKGSVTLSGVDSLVKAKDSDGHEGNGGVAATIAEGATMGSALGMPLSTPGIKFSGSPPIQELFSFPLNTSGGSVSGGNSGNYSVQFTQGDGATGSGTATISYTVAGGLPREETEVEIVPPDDYEKWMPQAGATEDLAGNFIEFEIVAHKKGDPDAPPPKSVSKYKIELLNTSCESGVDLNWPPKEVAKSDFDLRIDASTGPITLSDEQGQSAETKENNLEDFVIRVNSRDWGGYSGLRVTAQLKDGGSVVAHVRGQSGQRELAIPKDDNGNHIADAWEHEFNLQNDDASADEDTTPAGDGTNGDSIALYDEYRGFHIRGKHERLSPNIKDLFVWDSSNLGSGVYGDTSGVSVHLISVSERSTSGGGKNDNVVTPNGSHGSVYALWLQQGNIGDGGVGETLSDGGVTTTPAHVRVITIDANLIAAAYGSEAASELRSTIAHELGHGTNLPHHGDGPDYQTGDVVCRKPDGTVRNFLCSAKSKNGVGAANTDCFQVAAKGGMFSGNDKCLMRYDMTNFFEDPNGNCQWKHNGKTVTGSLYGQDPPGMTLCDDPRGTGVNDSTNPHNKAGDASPGRGACSRKLRLKD